MPPKKKAANAAKKVAPVSGMPEMDSKKLPPAKPGVKVGSASARQAMLARMAAMRAKRGGK